MKNLAYDNLTLLNEKYTDSLYLISDNNILNLIEKDNFDTCSKLKSLEYPIYFTYHHILNIVDYDKEISYKNKMNLLEMINNSLDNLIDYLNDYEEEDNNISEFIDDIYERYDNVKLNQKHNYFERIIYLFDEMVDRFRKANRYLYFSPLSYYPLINIKPGDFLEDEGECDSEDTTEEDTAEEDNAEEDNESDIDNYDSDNSDEDEN